MSNDSRVISLLRRFLGLDDIIDHGHRYKPGTPGYRCDCGQWVGPIPDPPVHIPKPIPHTPGSHGETYGGGRRADVPPPPAPRRA